MRLCRTGLSGVRALGEIYQASRLQRAAGGLQVDNGQTDGSWGLEIGLRMALGSQPGDVLELVTGEAMLVALLVVGIGSSCRSPDAFPGNAAL